MAKKVITFGEIMLRLATAGYYRFVKADTFGATNGRGEAKPAAFPPDTGFPPTVVANPPKHENRQACPIPLTKNQC